MSDLRALYAENEGKVSDKWSSYLSVYEALFAPRRSESIRLLEIGVQNGGSLEIWSRYFPAAETIVGCDIDPRCGALTYDDPRISLVIGDCASAETADKVFQISQTYDIIIDDGSHRSDDIVRAFALYFPHLAPGGLYIAEDLHCAYRAERQGGLEAPHSSISFFKRLVDLVNREHWGAPIAAEEALSFFARTAGATFDGAALQAIEQVSFRNSLAIVAKGEPKGSKLGHRVVSGAIAPVEPSALAVGGARFGASDESQNPFGPLTLRAEEAVADREAAATALRAQEAAKVELARLRFEAEALAQVAAAEFAERRQRLDEAGRDAVNRCEAPVSETTRRWEEQIRLLAALKRPEYDGRLPRKLTGPKSWAPGRRRRFSQLARDYRLIAASPLFDAEWYLANNPDVVSAGDNPILHFIRYGANEGRDPGPLFSTRSYLAANSDVAATNANALLHLIQHGAREGRSLATAANM